MYWIISLINLNYLFKKICIASDHAGYSLRMKIIQNLRLVGGKYQVKDLGTNSLASCDFPDYAKSLCEFLEQNTDYLGILVCGSGIGMSMAANRFKNVRAGLAFKADIAKLMREHNDANILVLPGKFMDVHEALKCIDNFLSSKFEGGRHLKRIKKIS